jgi:SAM-dependent methyltransferase
MMDQFTCNICGTENHIDAGHKHRELSACVGCGSNARFRALMLSLVYALKGRYAGLHELEMDKSVAGLGCSDSDVYGSRLRNLFSYTNTYLHTEPQLDIESSESFAKYSNLDFIICSDVIEHTLLAPANYLANFCEALKPGGALIISAPTYEIPYTIEKYPSLRTYTVAQIEDAYTVVYRGKNGVIGFDPSPFFHGGPGSVLEMRTQSLPALCGTESCGIRTRRNAI